MRFETPFGPAWASADDNGALTAFTFGEPLRQDNHLERSVARQIEEFFAGRRTDFDVALAPQGTDFQKRVWAELRNIPFGETISYAELARRIGTPGAARAAGRANSANPIAVIVPCHRVIGADGSLTGYAGGLELKLRLLTWERERAGLFAAADMSHSADV